jgi:hypothetical protein
VVLAPMNEMAEQRMVLLEQLLQAVVVMHLEDHIYGCGFENDARWSGMYNRTYEIAEKLTPSVIPDTIKSSKQKVQAIKGSMGW